MDEGRKVALLIAVLVLRTTLGKDILQFLSQAFTIFLPFANVGVAWLMDSNTSESIWFIISALPIIIFFTVIVQMAYYVSFIQWIVPNAPIFSTGR
ncbi:hypothetical protein BJ878DRAFT_521912 [Calycina marina]|uniref:Concentrative nucleoside transporter N-terminal domain-containing protein n=1 Tax=Calycina marina TaxID=1763456 RepID=A0A9P7YY11_9HELO|nr:hypothetical protein BJ878DRAFT_521912 [Calycina marina]